MTKPITDRPLKKAGRKPMDYDERIAGEVCERLSQGETLRAICEDPALPSHQTIYRWVAATPTFRTAYACARELQMDSWADDIIEIVDDASGDYVDRIGKNGETERVIDPASVQRSRLRVDGRKWLMARLAPKRFGDKVAVDVNAKVEIAGLSDLELEGRLQARLMALGVETAVPLLVQHVALPAPVEPVDIGEGEPADT